MSRCVMVLLMLLLSACAVTGSDNNYRATVSGWRWARINELTQKWGHPNQIVPLPNGNKVYVYKQEAYKNYPPPPVTASFATVSAAHGRTVVVVPSSPVNNMPQGPAFLMTCTTLFEVDPRDIIVDVRAQGNNCSADEGFAITRENPEARKKQLQL